MPLVCAQGSGMSNLLCRASTQPALPSTWKHKDTASDAPKWLYGGQLVWCIRPVVTELFFPAQVVILPLNDQRTVKLKLELPTSATAEQVLQGLGAWGTHLAAAIAILVLNATSPSPFTARQLAAKVTGGKKNQTIPSWRRWLDKQIESGKFQMNDSLSLTSKWQADQLELGTFLPLLSFRGTADLLIVCFIRQ